MPTDRVNNGPMTPPVLSPLATPAADVQQARVKRPNPAPPAMPPGGDDATKKNYDVQISPDAKPRAEAFQTIKMSCGEKETAGAKVEACFEALILAGATLGQYRERFCAQPANRPATLSACVETLTEIATAIGEETAGGKVLHHLLRGTR